MIVIKRWFWIIIVLVAVLGIAVVLSQYDSKNTVNDEQFSQTGDNESSGQKEGTLSSENNENDLNSKQDSLIDNSVSSSQNLNSSSQNSSENNNKDETGSDESEWTELYPATPID